MNENFIPSVFFTLFFVVDPVGLIPVFIIYLSSYDKKERIKIIIKTIVVAIIISAFFVLVGEYLLKFLGISSGSFLVAGGILLFLVSIDMLFARPSRMKLGDSCLEPKEVDSDVSVFPLAIPMLCGPGNIAALLMFSSQVKGEMSGLLIIIGISSFVFLLTMVVMLISVKLKDLLGETGISVAQRLIGLILSALSVQFIVKGLKEVGLI